MDIDLPSQRLFFRGKQLENEQTLFDYSINVNDVIQLMIRQPLVETQSNNIPISERFSYTQNQQWEQGNYSLRRPPKRIIPQIFIEQRWATVYRFMCKQICISNKANMTRALMRVQFWVNIGRSPRIEPALMLWSCWPYCLYKFVYTWICIQ